MLKKALLIFDSDVDLKELSGKLDSVDIDEIHLFAVTSDWLRIEEVKKICAKIEKTVILESALLINNEVSKISRKVAGWSAAIGDRNAGGRSLKEWFLVPRKEVSTWWFSLISEKNVFKTDVFFHIAQLQAVNELVNSAGYNTCYLGIRNRKLSKAIKSLCREYHIDVKLLKLRLFLDKGLIKDFLRSSVVIKDFFYPLFWLAAFFLRSLKTKIVLGKPAGRQSKKNSLLFITYFPALEQDALAKGVFKNKYAIPLQDKLREMNRPVAWLLMYMPIGRKSYSYALSLAKKFIKNAEILFFAEDFFSFKGMFNSLLIWIAQLFKYINLIFKLPRQFLTEGFTIEQANILLYPIWRDSFIGQKSMEGIVYFELYKRALNYFKDCPDCVYYTEMQAWEKALNAAKNIKAKGMKTIGFQHVSIGRNFFPYLYAHKEMDDRNSPTSLPMPDVMACNGLASYEFLKGQNYSNLKIVESVRQHYLFDCLKDNRQINRKEQILLIAGSYYVKETALLISLFHSAFEGKPPFKVWIKGHPMAPAEEVCDLLKIDCRKYGYEIKKDIVGGLLDKATMVLVGFSTVGVEALTYGCEVFIPLFSDQMFISSLQGFEEYYSQVTSPQELRRKIERFIKYGKSIKDKELKDFISKYWCLDGSLKRWEELLV